MANISRSQETSNNISFSIFKQSIVDIVNEIYVVLNIFILNNKQNKKLIFKNLDTFLDTNVISYFQIKIIIEIFKDNYDLLFHEVNEELFT
jgi:hypothetical protein